MRRSYTGSVTETTPPSLPLAVLTSGGDAPGMNAALRAVVKVSASRGVPVVGVEGGYTGLREGRLRALTSKEPDSDALTPDPEIDFAATMGGTMLGSAREPRFVTPEGRKPALEVLRGLSGLVVIGGNGSLAGAHALAGESDTPVVGIPASIDHDVGCTGTSIGVDTALNTIVACCDRISDTARAHRRAFVVEVMGRDSGYLAMAGAVAAGADAVLFGEQGRDEATIIDAVEAAIRRAFGVAGKRRVLIVKAEGVTIPCTALVRQLDERLGDLPEVGVRATVLGHLVRGGSPSFQDRMVAGRLGLAAVDAVRDGVTDVMAAWQAPRSKGDKTPDPHVSRVGLADVLAESRALIDGTSEITRWRVAMMEQLEGVFGL